MDFFRAEMSHVLKFFIRTGIMRLICPNFKRYLQEIFDGKDVVFGDVPHMIVAAAPKNTPCREVDLGTALSCFDFFAQPFGVGTCWFGFAVPAFRRNRKLCTRLNLPSGYKIGAMMLFGKPDAVYARATAPAQFELDTGGKQE